MPKKSHKLDGTHELPFTLIAISCTDSFLKLTWNLNKDLGLNFRESDIKVLSKDNPTEEYPVMSDRTSYDTRFFSLIPNKSSTKFLVKELPNIDYILEVSGDLTKTDLSNLFRKIKAIKGIVAAVEINPEKIKRRNAFCPI